MSGWLEDLPTLLFELVIGFPCISNLLEVDSYPKVIAMSADVWRMNSENSEAKVECPCRSKAVSENLSDWDSMNNGEFGEGDAVVRVRTDMTLPNPALRD